MPSLPKMMGGRNRIDAEAVATQYNIVVGSGIGTLRRGSDAAPTSTTRAQAEGLTVKYQSGRSLELKATSSDKVKYQAIKDHYKKTHSGQKLPFEARIALRPKPGSAIDAASIGAMHDALAGKGELRKHVKQPKADALVSDQRYMKRKGDKEDKKLGEGAFNEVYARRFKVARTSSPKAFFGIGRVKTRVIKESGPLIMTFKDKATGLEKQQGHPHAMQTGIDYNEPRVADRNVAARTSDKHLGLDIAPKAAAGIFDGKPCLAMKLAPGRTCAQEYVDHPEMILDSEFQHQMSDAEVSAFASGHTDPHMANMMVQRTEKKSLIGGETKVTYKLTLVDNDTCHSPGFKNPDKPPVMNAGFPIQFRSTGLPAYIDAATARKVEKLDIEAYRTDLLKNLTAEEAQSSCDRMQLLKSHVDFLRSENRIVKDWKAFTNASGKGCAGESVIEGTLAMPGVQQGFKSNGEPHIVPRSMFLRDVQDAAAGRHKVDREDANGKSEKTSPKFRQALGPALHDKIILFDRQDRMLMPPSSDSGQYRRREEVFQVETTVPQDAQPVPRRDPVGANHRTSGFYGEVSDPSGQAEPDGIADPSEGRSSQGTASYNVEMRVQSGVGGGGPEGTAPYNVEMSVQSAEAEQMPDSEGYWVSPQDGVNARSVASGEGVGDHDDMLAHIQAQRDSFMLG